MKQITLRCILPIMALCFLLTACNNQEDIIDTESIPRTEETSQTEHVDNAINVAITEPIIAEPTITEVDFSSYFKTHNGSAVFFNAEKDIYDIYNMTEAQEQRSPCSTFKIVSTLAALEYETIASDNSLRKWSGETFWKADWNRDITLEDAFKTSCIWYYREIINEIGSEKMQAFIDELGYGNHDISDWEGKLNKNNNNRALTGFWVESSLLISPIEQVNMLSKIFGEETHYRLNNVQILKEVMKVKQDKTTIDVYGKTGYGKLKNVSLDSWFIGMFELNSEPTYFAIHLSETEDPDVTSALAKEIALQIIADNYAE